MITTTNLFLATILIVYTIVWRSSRRLKRSIVVFFAWIILLGVVIHPYVHHVTPWVNHGLGVVRAELQAELHTADEGVY